MNAIRWIERRFEPVLITAAVSLIVALIFTNVVLRLFDTTLPWAGELSRYLFVWMVYLGISYCIKEHRHLRVMVFLKMLPRRGQKAALVLADVIFLVYSVLVAYYGYLITMEAVARGQIAPALEISVGVLYASILVGGVLSVFRLLANIIATLAGDDPVEMRS
ncbi:TRAP transporter small permease [Halomonas borealis]|uniref:TRAP transporter small permease n=1 Tax=Halomonas borealis TaxID=2508710 RepID=UPI001447FE8A|nr:TRAP transporter small permease [Halomonas borealis]